MQEAAEAILAKIRTVALARVTRRQPARTVPLQWNKRLGTEKLIAIGASTGGTEAVREILTILPPDSPAVLVTQHMPPGFTRSFAERLDGASKLGVAEAVHGERVLSGRVYIAPGGRHMAVQRSGSSYQIQISDDDAVNRHKPSVDVLFRSVAASAGPNAAGIMLTGMGRDGAAGMLEMKRAGAFNVAQDEATCVVFGMPREAIVLGAVDEVLPLQAIAERVLEHLGKAAVVPGQQGSRSTA
jgi:two-component system chemotaxis response regulator CheB